MDKYKEIKGIVYKRCSSHKDYVLMDEKHFSKRSASKDGFAYSCKVCEKKTSAKSYEKRRAKEKAKEKYEESREVYIARSKARYEENKEEILAQQKEWRATKKGKEIMNKAGAVRRKRMIDQTPDGRDYVREQVVDRDSMFGECICQICGIAIDVDGGELEIDHIVPISAGGSDIMANVRCTHKSCNNTRPKDGRDLEAN